MTDPLRRIGQLQRALDISDDSETLTELLILRARVEGEQVYLEALNDRLQWNRYPESVQEQAIEVVERNLGESFGHRKTEVYECAGISHRIATFEHVKSGALLNLIPGGRFRMGSADIEQELAFCKDLYEHWRRAWIAPEFPRRELSIPPLLVGRYLVRQQVWDRHQGKDQRRWQGEQLPIERVSWESCRAWLRQFNDDLRFLSESEWEYSYRAGSESRYFWGDEWQEAYSWVSSNSEGKSREVTEHDDKANAFGLVDMPGNLWEWCQDDWIDSYKDGPVDEKPRSVTKKAKKVIRGGAWYSFGCNCRAANRDSFSATSASADGIGFRIARSLC